MKGRVIKGVSSLYVVDVDGTTVKCSARGKLKREGEIFIGDNVELSRERGVYVIEKVLPRKNSLIRPYVSNIDLCFIVIAPVPKPDFTLVDKIIVNAGMSDIKPVLVVNKSDLADDAFIKEVKSDYDGVLEILFCSAANGDGVKVIQEKAKGCVACLAGQSAVGKSSVLNTLFGEERFSTGDLSRIERGRHTTRQSELVKLGDCYIIDTCGFSMLELPDDFKPEMLPEFYDDYFALSSSCRFKGCTHTEEPDCAVKKAVEEGKLSAARYERYVTLYKQLHEKWRKRYD